MNTYVFEFNGKIFHGVGDCILSAARNLGLDVMLIRVIDCVIFRG